MAEKALQKVENELICSICLEIYTNPKQLQCNHVNCQKCLVKWTDRDQQGQLILTCPSCREVTPVPANGVAGLKAAFRVNRFLEIMKEHKKGTDGLAQDESCPEHPNEELKRYCETCGKLICLKCAIKGLGVHHDHNHESLEIAYEKYKKEINLSLEKHKKALNDLDSCHLKITDQQANIEAHINSSIERLQAILEVRKTQLIGQLHQVIQSKLKRLAAQKDQLETTLAQLESCHDFMKKRDSHRDMLAMVNQVSELTAPIQLKPCTEADLLYSQSAGIIADCQNYGQISGPSISNPSQCYATGEGLNGATVEENTAADLPAVNSNGKPCVHHNIISVECELISDPTSSPVLGRVEKIEQRKFEISYQPTIKGKHSLHIKVEGQHIKGSPFRVATKSFIEHLGDSIGSIERINGPWGVELTHKHELIISGQRDHCIHVFTQDGKRLRSFGSRGSGQGQFNSPAGVTVNKDGNIFVADTGNHRVQKFTADGQFLRAVGEKGKKNLQFDRPYGIAVNSTSNKVYVADSFNNRVQVLTSDLNFLSSFGNTGSGRGQFFHPKGIACDCEREVLYVADQVNNRIQVFTEEGEAMREFGSYGNGEGEVNRPSCVAVDSNGMVYVSEAENKRISVFTPDGEFVKSFGGSETLQSPCGLVVNSNGVVYVCDINTNCTLMFQPF